MVKMSPHLDRSKEFRRHITLDVDRVLIIRVDDHIGVAFKRVTCAGVAVLSLELGLLGHKKVKVAFDAL